jgi:Ran GTPase-activating protein (RanGAP) involved in mRNA processing and transport
MTAAQMNSTLLTLNLDFNTTLRSDGVCSLAKGLKLNSTLKRLSLRFCGIRENGGTPISDIISFQRSSIESIDLEGNHLGGTGVKNLCPGLKSNTSLLQISLADIGLSSSDCGALESFGESICKHKTLTELNFMRNIIGKPGALALSKHLEHNKKIISIKVDTTLCPESYEALCRIPACEKKKRKKKSKKKKK